CHVGLLGLGAFMTGVSASTWHFPFLLAMGIGMCSTGAVALLLGLSALRVRGLYLAVMTLAFAVVLENYVFPRPFFAHGGAGLPVKRPRFGSIHLTDDRTFLAVALVALALFLVVDRKVLGSPAGRALVGLRENQVAAMARGIRPTVLPVLAFGFSGMAAGLAGGLFAYRQGLVAATSFPALASFTFVLY